MDHPDLLCDTLCCTDSALHMEISSQRYLHNNNLHSWQHPHFPIYWEAHFSLWEMLLAWHIKEQLLTTQKKKKIPTSHIRAPPQPLTRMWESSLPRWLPDFAHTWHARASAALSLRRASSAWSARPWTTLSMCLVLSCLAGKHLAWQPHSPRAEIRMTRIYSPTELKGEPLACLAHSSQPNSAIGAGLSFRNSHSQPLVTRPACARLGLLPRATLQKNGETQPLCCYDSSNLHRFMGHNRSVT